MCAQSGHLNHELNISAIAAPAKDVTTAVAQTLTCEIGDVDDGNAVAVTWKMTSEGAALAEGDDYTVDQGSVVEGVQKSFLTIKAGKMATFADQDSFTYLCSAQSSQYSTSPASRDFDVVANVLTFGKLRFLVQAERFITFYQKFDTWS